MFLNDISNMRYRFRHFNELEIFKFGITIPMIFNQSAGYSDNEETNENYENIIEQAYWNALPIQKNEVMKKEKKNQGFCLLLQRKIYSNC